MRKVFPYETFSPIKVSIIKHSTKAGAPDLPYIFRILITSTFKCLKKHIVSWVRRRLRTRSGSCLRTGEPVLEKIVSTTDFKVENKQYTNYTNVKLYVFMLFWYYGIIIIKKNTFKHTNNFRLECAVVLLPGLLTKSAVDEYEMVEPNFLIFLIVDVVITGIPNGNYLPLNLNCTNPLLLRPTYVNNWKS